MASYKLEYGEVSANLFIRFAGEWVLLNQFDWNLISNTGSEENNNCVSADTTEAPLLLATDLFDAIRQTFDLYSLDWDDVEVVRRK